MTKPLDLDAIEARWEKADRLDAPGPVIGSWRDVPALVAEVRRLRADLAAVESALDGSVVPAPGDSLARRVYERAQSCVDLTNYANSLRADLDAMTASRDGWREIVREHVDAREAALRRVTADLYRSTQERLSALKGREYNPLATRCGAPTDCNTVFDAPADVKVGDVLRCPTCNHPSVVIDTGHSGHVEYIRARDAREGEVTPRALLTEPSRDEMERVLGDLDETFAYGWTIRRCIDCRTPVAGGPTRCLSCAGRALP